MSGIPRSPLARFAGRVLLVEDNRVNRLVTGELLEHLGLELEFAEDGLEALDRLGGQRFDVVLMDCLMPKLDGFAATRQWRERERAEGRAHTPIIAVTANATAADRDRCFECGMDDFLAKPVILQSLIATLERYLPRA